jgi:D-alanyl-lipoteichoic acid acyltransferase DltB (MBOAT superfamily)
MAFVPKYILILLALIVLDFFLARLLENNSGKKRFIYLWISTAANIGILLFFKYFNFFSINVSDFSHLIGWNYSLPLLSFILPLGLSFHVFQSLSYVIEVYKGKYKAEKNIFIYALYVMFFPQLVAGPIERPQHLLPQLHLNHPFDEKRAILGLERILWGLFKKLVIADNLAILVNNIYASGTTDGPKLILVIIIFAYQLYCDFSGYSDIAVGTARVLGIELTENFNRPYASRSIADFWRRWHISLSSWLRDYLYYPLALSGSKHSQIRLFSSLFVTFVLIGFWHGANWTFVTMGAIFGFYLVFGSVTRGMRRQIAEKIGLSRVPLLYRYLQTIATFTLVSLAWVFFRSPTVTQAIEIITNIGNGFTQIFDINYLRYELFSWPLIGTLNKWTLLVILLSIFYMEWLQAYSEKKKVLEPWRLWTNKNRLLWGYAIILIILMFGYFGGESFIYFKF